MLFVLLGAGLALSADRRGIGPSDSGPSMAAVPVVEIGNETRPVLSRARRRALKLNERVVLPEGSLEVPVELPDDLDASVGVKVEASVSLRDPDTKGDMKALRNSERVRLEPVSMIVRADDAKPALSVPVPPDVVGNKALLTVVARELPADVATSTEVGPWAIHSGDRLEFGYAVESPAWGPGFPPVRFRVVGIPEDGGEVEVFDRRLDPAADVRDRRWMDASVGLDALAGERARFRFESESLAHADDVTVPRSLPVYANPRVRAAASAEGKKPNIVLISLDTLRASSTSAYGYRHPTTPNLESRVAKAGALVKEAVVPVAFTPPSHMTMLTGLEPCAHGVTDRDGILAPEDVLLAEILRADGYDTAAFTENAYVVAGAGFARGFDTYVEMREDASAAPGFGVETFRAAEDWIARGAHAPFFLFVHTYQVHKPYTPPRGYRDLFGDYPESDTREQRWKREQQAYDQEIRYTDDLLGGFLDALEAHGLVDDTILVVTSDHGEEFGRHTWGGHGFGVWDAAVLVPLVVRAPGLVPPGTIVEAPVGIGDLVPTLLDLAEIPLPRPVQGQSFAPLLRAEKDAEFRPRPLVSRTIGGDMASIRFPEFKYVLRTKPSKAERIYVPKRDPDEQRPLAPAKTEEKLEESRKTLEGFERSCREYRAAHPVTAGKDALYEQRPDWLINRNEIERKLRSLGYVD